MTQVPPVPLGNQHAGHQEPLELPRNAKLVSLMMQAMGVDDFQPQVLPQLLDFVHRYTLDVVGDAQLFAEHAGRSEVDVDDVRLAVEGKLTHSFTGVPSKETLQSIADSKNIAPLPLIQEKIGLRLPPERNTLTGVNFQILPKKPNLEERPKPPIIPAALSSSTSMPAFQQQQQFQQFQPQMPMGFGGAPIPAPFLFGNQPAPNAFNPMMPMANMNMSMNNDPNSFMAMMGGGGGGPQTNMFGQQQPMMQQQTLFMGANQSMKMEEDDYDD